MKKILVFGGTGLVGSKFLQLQKDKFDIKAPGAQEIDILEEKKVAELINQSDSETVINFAAFTQVEIAEEDKGNKEGIAYKLNALGAKNVADACKVANKKLIHISTEYVFDGTKSDCPYNEEDKPNPKNWYGQTKYFGEQFIMDSGCKFTMVRISMPFSPYYELKKDVARFFFEQLKNKTEINAISDQKITPTLVSDISSSLEMLINKEAEGIYHICSKNYTTPFEFAKLIAQTFEFDSSLIKPILLESYNQKKMAKLLKFSWLDCHKFEQEFGDNVLHNVADGLQVFKQAVDGSGSN